MQDNKSTDNSGFFRALFWALLVFLLWTWIAPRFFPTPPSPKPSPNAPVSTSQPVQPTAEQPAGQAVASNHAPNNLKIIGADSTDTITLGETSGELKSPYRMQVIASPIGASINTVFLSDHRQNVKTQQRYRLVAPLNRGDDRRFRSFAVSKITVDGVPLAVDEIPWRARRLIDGDMQIAEFTLTVAQSDKPIVEVVRRYALSAQPHASGRSDLDQTIEVRNLSTAKHDVLVTLLGAVGITNEGSRFGVYQKVLTATSESGIISLSSEAFNKIAKKQLVNTFRADSPQKFDWVASANQYFTCTLCPIGATGDEPANWVGEASAIDLDEDAETHVDGTMRLITKPLTLEPGQSRVLRASLYLGPKDREAFKSGDNPDYVKRQYMLQITQGYGSCTFNFLTNLMINLLNWLEGYVRNFGVAIIIMVVIVRTLLHPITKKTQVNMVRMQQNMGRMQPKMEEIKRKFGNDKLRMQQEMMKLHREEGVNPVGQLFSCLPMFLQMPIWVALWSSLNNNVAMRCRGFVFWIDDLTLPDHLFSFSHPIHLPIVPPLDAFNLLPILVGIFMFSQQKLLPKPKAAPATANSSQANQAEQMQKIMPYMSLIMIFFFYGFPSGLNLYIMTSSMLGTIEQIYIRKHIKQVELKAAEGGGPGRGKPRRQLPGHSLWQRLAAQAEIAQKDALQRSKAGKKR